MLLLALLGVCSIASAQLFISNTVAAGNQNFGGALVQKFTVGSLPVTVTALGAFDSGSNGFAVGTTINVGLCTCTAAGLTGLVSASSTAQFTQASPGTLNNGFSYKSITSTTLAAEELTVWLRMASTLTCCGTLTSVRFLRMLSIRPRS